MNKRMLALAITALATTAWAQVPPAATLPVARAPAAVPQSLPPLPAGANPFTGVTKAQSEIDRSDEELKRLRGVSTQKLALQRDELEALRIEIDKKKLMDALNPPKPVEIKVITAPGVVTAPGAVKTPIAKKKPVVVVVVEKPAPTPPQIIAPSATKYEVPQVLGVIDIGGQKVAMLRFDGQTFRAASGSTVGGKPVANIEPNGVQWGSSFLTVASTSNAPPSIIITDDRTDSKNRSSSVQPVAMPQMSQVPTPSTIQPYSGPSSPVTFSPQGATRSTNGASGPTGVLQLPPPPPTLAR